MFIEFSEWIDDNTFVCNFGSRCDDGGDWFELVGEFQKDKNRFVFERVYDDCILPVSHESRKLMMRTAMLAAMKKTNELNDFHKVRIVLACPQCGTSIWIRDPSGCWRCRSCGALCGAEEMCSHAEPLL